MTRQAPISRRAAARLQDERLTLVGLLLETHQGLVARMGEVHAAHGLQGKEFSALFRLARSEHRSLSMGDLAAQTGTSTSGTTSMVDRLEQRGLVERVVGRTDRRSFDVLLTPAGHDLVGGDVVDLLPIIDECVIRPLGGDIDVVHAALERVRDVTTPGARSGASGAPRNR